MNIVTFFQEKKKRLVEFSSRTDRLLRSKFLGFEKLTNDDANLGLSVGALKI